MSQIVPADEAGCFVVVNGDTEQSYVDLNDPTRLEFEYVQRIAEVLDETVLLRSRSELIRVVHVGGGGLTLPRYVQARRPGTAQVVFEPDEQLMDEVRKKAPIAGRASIRIHGIDGAAGLAEMPSGCADAVVVDAFVGASVPAGLATAEFFADAGRVLRSSGVIVMNLTDSAPFDWAKRCIAGLALHTAEVGVIAESPVWKGRRFGNLIALGGRDIPVDRITTRLIRAAFPNRLVGGQSLLDWLGGAPPFTRLDAMPSPEPNWGSTWFGPTRRNG
jgi:hypothetical protein